ncbi:MAG: hypothetical protein M1819_004491 [Sarea resinae]|nr:MAG: hypothetical protein M1819_004491 [Sarea resinae]
MVDVDDRAAATRHTTLAGQQDSTVRPKSSDGGKPDLWSSLLDGVASGRRLPEKNILVLGGTPDTQKEFLESLSYDPSRKTQDRYSTKPPPIANQFALGYTYRDVLDADHEDILARLSLYLLTDPSPSFTTLLRPLLTPAAIPNTEIVILLDWTHPWSWLRQLRDWVRLLRSLLASLSDDSKEAMEELMISWRDRGRGGGGLDSGGGSNVADGDVSIPLGPGEWDEALGLPLCVVCQNADKMDTLEKERGWREEDFDFVLQFLRTVLLKHGASLIYTTPSTSSSLQTLVHSSLGIQSLLKRRSLKHNVIDRDKVLVPPNWDSWGKIRVLREGFDVEGVNAGWSVDIQGPRDSLSEDDHNAQTVNSIQNEEDEGLLQVYETTIRDPRREAMQAPGNTLARVNGHDIEIESLDTQDFLTGQLDIIDKIRFDEEQKQGAKDGRRDTNRYSSNQEDDDIRDGESGVIVEDRGRVNEHIGPVQFNVGGIQVDADDMLKRLKVKKQPFYSMASFY